jgi:hypothetical protein
VIALLGAAAPPITSPKQISDTILRVQIGQASGICAVDTGATYLVIFGGDGRYVTYRLEGDISGEGTYTYEQLSSCCSRISYHMTQGGSWQGGDATELLEWTNTSAGTIQGEQTHQGGGCTYDGSFTVMQFG